MKVLILGAGPAGTSCAIQLCKAGLHVTLLDITIFPRFRPGESCHPGIEVLLRQLDVWDEVVKQNPLRYNSYFVNDKGVEREYFFSDDKTWYGFQFPREDFDTLLLKKAISLGATFIPQTKTLSILTEGNTVSSVVTDKGEFRFDFLIDATGSKSVTSNKLGLNRVKYSKPIISHYSQVFSTESMPRRFKSYFEITTEYWRYISLIQPHTYSLTFSSNSRPALNKSLFLNKHFNANYSEILTRGFETSWCMTNNSSFDNLYLIGDALMTFDPTSSKGILKSIMTGIYAAHMIEALKTNKLTPGKANQVYQKWASDFFETELATIKQLLPPEMVKNVFA